MRTEVLEKIITVTGFSLIFFPWGVIGSKAQSPVSDPKEIKRQAKEEEKVQKQKAKEEGKLRKESGPDEISRSYDRFENRSVVSFNSLMFDKIWDNGTAIILGGEFNIDGNDTKSTTKTGRYFITLTYIVDRITPLSGHSLIFLADDQRVVFDRLQVSRYSKPSAEGILAKGVVVYTYQEVSREVLTLISKAQKIEARFNDLEFIAKPRYMNTMREFLASVP